MTLKMICVKLHENTKKLKTEQLDFSGFSGLKNPKNLGFSNQFYFSALGGIYTSTLQCSAINQSINQS